MQHNNCVEPALSTRGAARIYLAPGSNRDIPLQALDHLPELLRELPGRPTRQPGRTTCWVWRPSWCEGPGFMVRQYAHGGLLGPLFGVLFVGEGRMLRELRTAQHATDSGVPTAPPVALRIERVLGPLVRAHLVTELIPGARNLLELCRDPDIRRSGAARRAHLIRAVADAVAALHDAGIVHADLNLKNILVQDPTGDPRAFIIDFDRARVAPAVSLRQRMRNLARLGRSVDKWAASRTAVRPLDRLRLVRLYLRRYPAWGNDWKDILRRHGTERPAHSFFRRRIR